ncbi:hypothetical protein RRG08_041471 [Elysia crispata]|uniref:Uncharacterized protein n=1 Tax=Elysia crispata TaxID=231223 RepID=A0AAE0Y316_9GAST|nr:hypothetical protein RRG08_041471 [Elysia crispata]
MSGHREQARLLCRPLEKLQTLIMNSMNTLNMYLLPLQRDPIVQVFYHCLSNASYLKCHSLDVERMRRLNERIVPASIQ